MIQKHTFANLVKDCTDLIIYGIEKPIQQIRQKEDIICHICKKVLSPVDRVSLYHCHLTVNIEDRLITNVI